MDDHFRAIIGDAGSKAYAKFSAGEITFEECLDQMYQSMPPENIKALEAFLSMIDDTGESGC